VFIVRKAIAALAVVMVLMGSVPASAETIAEQGQRIYNTVIKPASNPYTAFDRLSDSQQKAVTVYMNNTKVTKSSSSGTRSTSTSYVRRSTGARVLATETCKYHVVTVTVRGPLDNTLLKWNQQIDWCYSLGKITSIVATRWNTTHAIFWQFDQIGEKETWGTGSSSGGAFSQAHFKLCFYGDIGCVDSSNPWIRQTISNGYSIAWSGGA